MAISIKLWPFCSRSLRNGFTREKVNQKSETKPKTLKSKWLKNGQKLLSSSCKKTQKEEEEEKNGSKSASEKVKFWEKSFISTKVRLLI